MEHVIYKQCKEHLKEMSEACTGGDNLEHNMILNDTLDYLIKNDLSEAKMREKISQKQFDLYSYWLDNYVTKLHRG